MILRPFECPYSCSTVSEVLQRAEECFRVRVIIADAWQAEGGNDAQALQREHGCRIANVAVGNMGLDGKNVHGSGKKIARHMAGLFSAMGEHGSAEPRATQSRQQKRGVLVRQNVASGVPKAKGRAKARPVCSRG